MGSFEYTICDVFTDRPLAGNQLAVFTDAVGLPADRLQPLARELNLSETVYVYPPESGGDARIRIFTPATELPFAGHPVLGTAFVLGQLRGLELVTLETGGGNIPIALERSGEAVVFGRMTQPVPTWHVVDDPAGMLAALGLGRSELPPTVYRNGPEHVFFMAPDVATLAAIRPQLDVLREYGVMGFNCFARDGESGWRTRMFGPALGVNEDPATGSAAGPLAVHLARHGLAAFGTEVIIVQGIEIGRPSTLYARVQGQGDRIDSVEVGGRAVIVAGGAFHLVPS